MTWPTSSVSTSNLDNGLDNPALARIELLQAVKDVNNVAAEFGNVGISSAANLQMLQYNGTASQWQNTFPELHRYKEKTYDHGTTGGNITINYDNGNVQRITSNGTAISFGFSNWPVTGTVSVLIQHGVSPATATWPATVKAAANDRYLSLDANVTDLVHISTIGSTSTYYLTVVRGYQ
jgi:hypothetical protein